MTTENISHPTNINMAQDKDSRPAENVLTAGIRSAWNQGLLVDTTVKVDGRDFHANKVVLASRSLYFRKLLTGDQSGCNKDSIVVEEISALAMELLITYMHTNQLDLKPENASEMLAAAQHLQIKSALGICLKFMIDSVDDNNWFDMLTLFRSYNFPDIIEKVKDYVKTNIRVIVKFFDSGKLSYDDLCFFLHNWQSSEYDLFLFIKQWVHSEAERESHVNDLLSQVRYCLMTTIELEAIKELKLYHDSNDSWRHLVEKAVTYHQLPFHLKVLDDSNQTKVRSAPTFLTFSNERTSFGGYFYERLKEKRLIDHEGLEAPVSGFDAAMIVNNFLIVCSKSYMDDQRWYIFDPRTLEWGPMVSFPRDPEDVVWAHDKRFIFGIGGHIPSEEHGEEWIDDITCYDLKTNSWSDMGEMPYDTSDVGACALANGLYICGGDYDDETEFEDPTNITIRSEHRSSKMVCLDLTSREWKTMAPMLQPRSNHMPHVMTLHGEEIITIFDKSFNMDYYSPSKNQWTRYIVSLNAPYPERSYCKREWVRGNSLFIGDVVVRQEFKDSHGKGHGCAIITYQENSTEAKVEYIEQRKEYRYGICRAVLSFDPHISKHDV